MVTAGEPYFTLFPDYSLLNIFRFLGLMSELSITASKSSEMLGLLFCFLVQDFLVK